MAKRGENIYLRKDGRYEGRYVTGHKPNGKTAFGYIYGRKYCDVKRRLCIARATHTEKTSAAEVVFIKTSVASWLYLWLNNFIGPEIKSSTLGIYKKQIEKYILPIIGPNKLHTIDKVSMRILYDSIQKNGGSVRTAQTVLRRFRGSLVVAQEENLISAVPPLPFRKGVQIKREPRFLTKSEQQRLECELAFDSSKDLAVLLALYTGMRVGECCALKWKDIDFVEHEINTSHTYQRISVFGEESKTALIYSIPKTAHSIRKIPMTSFLETLLFNYKKRINQFNVEFVFFNTNGPLEPRALQYHIKKLEVKSKIKDIHFHTLRHTFATRCLEKQIDIKTLSELLGHSSAQITLDWYCHSSNERKKTFMKQLDKKAV